MPQGPARFKPVDGIIIFVVSIIVSIGVTLLISSYVSIKTAALISTLVMMGVAIILLVPICGNPFAALGEWRIGKSLIVLTIVASIALVPVSLALEAVFVSHFGIPPQVLEALLELLRAENLSQLVYVWFITALIAAIGEEVVFRGILQRSLLGWMNGWQAILVTSVLFSLLHTFWRMAPILMVSLFLGWLYFRTGSLVPSIVAHLTINTYAVVSGWITANFTDETGALSSETQAPPIPVLLISIVVFALSSWRIYKLLQQREVATAPVAASDDIKRAC